MRPHHSTRILLGEELTKKNTGKFFFDNKEKGVLENLFRHFICLGRPPIHQKRFLLSHASQPLGGRFFKRAIERCYFGRLADKAAMPRAIPANTPQQRSSIKSIETTIRHMSVR